MLNDVKPGDSIIVCYRWSILSTGVKANCKGCNGLISAYPVSVEKANTPGYHLLCTECFEVIKERDTVIFRGDIKGNKFPETLEN